MESIKDSPPANASELREVILSRYDGLSKRLQHVARYVLDHPDDIALQTLTVIAGRSGAQPSAIVRFAKALGFSGAGPMQKLLRDNLVANNTALGYAERVLLFNSSVDDAVAQRGVGALIDEFAEGDILALQNARAAISAESLASAIELVRDARIVHIIGMRRSFAVASYLAYALPQAGKPVTLLDGVGGMVVQQCRAIRSADLVVAISHRPYAAETVRAVEMAVSAGAKVLAISDSFLSPIAKLAARTLLVRESAVRGFRSLSASICVAQALVVGLAYDLELVASANGIEETS